MKLNILKVLFAGGLLTVITLTSATAADRVSRPPSTITRDRLLQQSGVQERHRVTGQQLLQQQSIAETFDERGQLRSSQATGEPINRGTDCEGFCPTRKQTGATQTSTNTCSVCNAALWGPNAYHSAGLITDGICDVISLPLSDGMLALIVCCLCYAGSVAVVIWRRKKSEK
jgi:hypothetical protein